MVAALSGCFLAPASTFQRYARVQEVKSIWKELSKQWERLGVMHKGELLGTLPAAWEKLPPRLQARIEKGEILPTKDWPVTEMAFQEQYTLSPVRSSNSQVSSKKAEASVSGGVSMQCGGADLLGAMQVFAAALSGRAAGSAAGLANLEIFGQGQRAGVGVHGAGQLALTGPSVAGGGGALPGQSGAALALGDQQVESQNESQQTQPSAGAELSAVGLVGALGARRQGKGEENPAEGGGGGKGRAVQEVEELAGPEAERPLQEARAPKKRPASGGGDKGPKKRPAARKPAGGADAALEAAAPVDGVAATAPAGVEVARMGGSGGNKFAENVPRWGYIRAEFYKEKSYIRWWSEEEKKLKMVVSDATKRHRRVCEALWPHVLQGKTRAELLEIKKGLT